MRSAALQPVMSRGESVGPANAARGSRWLADLEDATGPAPRTVRKVSRGGSREYVISAEQYRGIISQLVQVLVVVDSDGVCEWVGPVAAPSVGWSLHVLAGHPLINQVHPDDRPANLVWIDPAMANRELGPVRRWLRADGSWQLMSSVATPRLSVTGSIVGLVLGLIDAGPWTHVGARVPEARSR